MFNGHGQLDFDSDHIVISFREPEIWPSLTPLGSIKAFTFDVGDPVTGPGIQLGLMSTLSAEPLDWKHSIDPMHHHGSDQFRIVLSGDWSLARRQLRAGSFAFQEAGWIYQEHPASQDMVWMMLVMGDRRGTRATLRLSEDNDTVFDAGEAFGVPSIGSPYPHPAGDRGVAAIATSLGSCQQGYLRGRFEDLADEGDADEASVCGVLGDENSGPLIHILNVSAGRPILPPSICETERILISVAGSFRIGSKEYRSGEIYVQKAGAPMGPLASGGSGSHMAVIVADRRCSQLSVHAKEDMPQWTENHTEILSGLRPRLGGPAIRKKAAATSARTGNEHA